MTHRFTCRGFEGEVYWSHTGWWVAYVVIAPDVRVWSGCVATPSAAKSRVRRKLDAVERAFRERGRR